MADYTPLFVPGHAPTLTAGGTIVGGQLVSLSAANTVVATTTASAAVVGVASKDAVSGDILTIHRRGVQILTAAGTIAFGAHVKSAASGQVAAFVPGTDDPTLDIGVAFTASTATNPVTVALRG